MKVFNLERDLPTVSEAGKKLAQIIRENKSNEKVIKLIHGYGSSGVGGKIKISVQKSLRKRVNSGEIKAYIPGEAFSSLFGFDEQINKYKDLIRNDSDYKKGNDGITYIVF
ncbi:MAG: hypothetical protein JEZ05_07075 [Tenericutes bacterium]|nr:hypothetical protein [Mycoplasmatota bacterium]